MALFRSVQPLTLSPHPSGKETVFPPGSGLSQWVWQSRATTPGPFTAASKRWTHLRLFYIRCLAASWGGLVLHPSPSALPLAVLPLCVALRRFILPSGNFPQSDQRYCSWGTSPDNNFDHGKCARVHFNFSFARSKSRMINSLVAVRNNDAKENRE